MSRSPVRVSETASTENQPRPRGQLLPTLGRSRTRSAGPSEPTDRIRTPGDPLPRHRSCSRADPDILDELLETFAADEEERRSRLLLRDETSTLLLVARGLPRCRNGRFALVGAGLRALSHVPQRSSASTAVRLVEATQRRQRTSSIASHGIVAWTS